MKYIKADLKRPIPIGRQGENGVTTVQFPVRVFFPDMEEATYTLVHSREGDKIPYLCATILNEDMLEWLVSKADVDKSGAGVLQLTASSGEDKIGKSIILTTQTEKSLGEAGDAPEAMESWLANMEVLVTRAERGAEGATRAQAAASGSATAAAESASIARGCEVAAEVAVNHYPKIENATWWVWNPVTGEYVDTGVSAIGPEGPQGPKGDGNYVKPDTGIPETDLSDDVTNKLNDVSLNITNASVGDFVRVGQVDGSGKPVSWLHAAINLNACNDNLLDNWYFKNPVNQRGQSSWLSPGYTIDRWKLTSGTAYLSADGITLNGTLEQILETAIGEQTVRSFLRSSGSAAAIATSYNDATRKFTITATGQTIAAVKLELGSMQTLYHTSIVNPFAFVLNEIPDYGEELAKCQRYYYKAHFTQLMTIGYCYQGEGWFDAELSLPVSMRTQVPTITQTGEFATIGNAGAFSHTTPSNIIVSGTTAHIGYATDPTQAQTLGAGYYYPPQDGELTFELSCDLEEENT